VKDNSMEKDVAILKKGNFPMHVRCRHPPRETETTRRRRDECRDETRRRDDVGRGDARGGARDGRSARVVVRRRRARKKRPCRSPLRLCSRRVSSRGASQPAGRGRGRRVGEHIRERSRHGQLFDRGAPSRRALFNVCGARGSASVCAATLGRCRTRRLRRSHLASPRRARAGRRRVDRPGGGGSAS
jgi:hypothetical protein